jgi:hypothetical protein
MVRVGAPHSRPQILDLTVEISYIRYVFLFVSVLRSMAAIHPRFLTCARKRIVSRKGYPINASSMTKSPQVLINITPPVSNRISIVVAAIRHTSKRMALSFAGTPNCVNDSANLSMLATIPLACGTSGKPVRSWMDIVECLTVQISTCERMSDSKLNKGWKRWWERQLSPADLDVQSERSKSGSEGSEDTE